MKIDKPPICPHCKTETQKYDVQPWDGGGWGVPFLYVCFNDDCPLYIGGQKHIEENYGQVASYRYMVYPDTGKEEIMVAYSPMFFQKKNIISKEDEEEE
ncbi:MAG: hypothetical protein HY755_02445 [Nitrospirae bacterium]|nr:hypothetical protein [Nitrospirota bacterium]